MSTSYIHERLTRSLLEEMASGVYREGQRFLSIRTIRRLWKISEPTALVSLRTLRELGLIEASARRGHFLCRGFQQRAQILLRRNRISALKPPLSLQQKMRVLKNSRGGKVVMILESTPSTLQQHESPHYMPASELRKAAYSFEREGRKLNFKCSWLPFSGNHEEVEWIRTQLKNEDFQGAVVYCRTNQKKLQWMLEPLLARQCPVVVIYDDCSGLAVNSINLNNVGLGYDAIQHLYRMGHRRITILVRHTPLKVHSARLKGCLLAGSEKERQGLELQVLKLSPNKPPSSEVRRHFARLRERPTAVFTCESRLLSTLIPLWAELGITVPKDISVIMASSRTSLSGIDVPLDTMQLNVGTRMGKLAAQLLHNIQAGEPLEKSVLLDVSYARRGSVQKLSPPAKSTPPLPQPLPICTE